MKLRIEKSIYGGAGLGRHDGKAIFVPLTLAGELVEAGVVADHGSYAEAEMTGLLEASPERAAPRCPYFGRCGGCHYQHARDEEQVRMKAAILREALERAHIGGVPQIETVAAEPLGYRNRIRLHVQREPFALCYKVRGSHENLAVEECPIAAPVLQEALQALRGGAGALLAEWVEEIELFADATGESVVATLFAREGAQDVAVRLQSFWSAALNAAPALRGCGVVGAPAGKQRSGVVAAIGQPSIRYAAAGGAYQVSAGSFFQVNRFLIDQLVGLVTDGQSGALAWDLYAGVGLFARVLGQQFRQVVAVETGRGPVADLRENLAGTNARVVAASTLDFLKSAAKKHESRPELAVVDPPRAGLGKEVTRLLGQVRPAHITYVSCDPATLSRDLKSLLQSGYHLTKMYMVDLFPQTFHLESVAMLSLR